MFNYLVIGGGLFGSAALRYLSAQSNNVGLIGPAEPVDWAQHDGVFASHYDNGRLCSMFGSDATWTALHRAAIGQYQHIEETSGVPFYTPAGRFSITKDGGRKAGKYAHDNDGLIHAFTSKTIPADMPITIPADRIVYREGPPSGYINPRKLAEAQLTIAAQQGAQIIRQTVRDVVDMGSHVEVRTLAGEVFSAEKLLLATGAFTNHLNLLPRKLAIRTKSETTILAEVSQAEAERFQHLPSIDYDINDPEIHGIYLVPPLLYPDGKYYLKTGFDTPADLLNPSLPAIHDWFAGKNVNAHKEAARKAVSSLFPDLQVIDWHMKPCIVCYTPTRKPVVDAVIADRVYVAAAGNGTGAGPSDAIGHLAADLMLNGAWTSDLDRALFQARYADTQNEWYHAPLTTFPR
ncbi:MAG: FAD-dependent oxidoreductase [Candidatus Promineifilaceae bacterium]